MIDYFGSESLYPGKIVWESGHWQGMQYELFKTQVDPLNGLTRKRGNGGFRIDDCVLTLSGSTPRIYINGNWVNTEVTMYYKRFGNDGLASQGLVIGHRSEADGHSSNRNVLVHTYYTKLNHRGRTTIYKEAFHNSVDGKRMQWYGSKSVIKKYNQYFPDPLVTPDWLGFKSCCYDLPNGNVITELWIDEESGGETTLFKKENWKLIEWFEDDSTNFGCPNFHGMSGSCMIRNGGIKKAQYKFLTINEIDVDKMNADENTEVKINLTNTGSNNLIIKPGDSIEFLYK